MTAAKASPELMPNTATATAIANSKLLLAAVNAIVAVLRVVGPDLLAHPEAHQEHDDEVDQQRHGDPQHVERNLDDEISFEAEHDQDREQQRDQRDWADRRNELPLVPCPPFGPYQYEPSRHARQEGNAEVDEDALRDFADADLHGAAFQTEQRWQAR